MSQDANMPERKPAPPPNGPAAAPKPDAAAPEDTGARALDEALSSSFKVIKLLMVILAAAFACSGVFTVKPGTVAVILRFGRPVGVGPEQLLKQGLHWSWPYPIDEVVTVPVGQSRTVVARAAWAPDLDNPNQGSIAPNSLRPGIDGCALTGDGNLIHARATLKYRLQPAGVRQFAFHFQDATNLLENALNNAIYYAATHFTAEAVIFKDKLSFREMVQRRLTQSIEDFQLGAALESLDVETSAPLDVRAAFNDVVDAQQTFRTRVSEAETYARNTTNAAAGQASVLLNDGLTRSNQVLLTLAAEARSFSDQRPYFEADPVLFKQRLATETLARALTNVQEKFFIPRRADGQPRELRLQLNREPQKPKTEPAAQP